jgi:DNA sulfur modification protein DndB
LRVCLLTNKHTSVNYANTLCLLGNLILSEDSAFEYVFPAIRGLQAGREYYVSMCPMRLIPKIFLFDEEELVPELRAQRTLNKNRIPEMANYILDKRNEYVFSALTASVDADLRFAPFEGTNSDHRIGLLHIPMSAVFIINDGQHRRAAIEAALRENPDLADETIAIVFFLDIGLKRCQQMFADLNRYAVKPSKSLGLLYDHSDEWAEVARLLVSGSRAFKDVVEMEKTTLSARSRRLFTLSAIHSATKILMQGVDVDGADERVSAATDFWNEVDSQIPEWGHVRTGRITSGEMRQDYIHSHGVVLSAIGRVGNGLIKAGTENWAPRLKGLSQLDWRRSNSALWEGRAMRNGRISKSNDNVTLTANAIKTVLSIPLTPEEQKLEDTLNQR